MHSLSNASNDGVVAAVAGSIFFGSGFAVGSALVVGSWVASTCAEFVRTRYS